MALKTQIGSDLPIGAVALTKEEALAHQWNLVKKWPAESEVLFLKFGKHIASASTLFSSLYIISFYKNILKLGRVHFTVTSFPAAVLPTFITYSSTDRHITNSRLLMTLNCPICDQLKFGASQLYLSMVFPAAFGYFTMALFAFVLNTYPVPDLKKNSREFWRTSGYIFKQGSTRFQVVGLVQSVLILFLPYMQNVQLLNIISKSKQENEVLSSELDVNF